MLQLRVYVSGFCGTDRLRIKSQRPNKRERRSMGQQVPESFQCAAQEDPNNAARTCRCLVLPTVFRNVSTIPGNLPTKPCAIGSNCRTCWGRTHTHNESQMHPDLSLHFHSLAFASPNALNKKSTESRDLCVFLVYNRVQHELERIDVFNLFFSFTPDDVSLQPVQHSPEH